MLFKILSEAAAVSSLLVVTSAQTFQRLGACPTLGCVLPPDQYAISRLHTGAWIDDR